MAFDPFLYVALAAGVLAGRLLPHPGPWVPRATLVTVGLLVGLLGASLSAVAPAALLLTVPLALAFAALVLGLTAAVYLALARRGPPRAVPVDPPRPREQFPLSLALLAALLAGYALGRLVHFPAAEALTYALYALLVCVGFDLPLHWKGLRELWVPLTASVVAAAGTALLFALVPGIPLGVSLATGLAFGWYSLAGPLVLARAGAALGLLAFLANFLRENLTMLLAPLVGHRLRGGGLAALGGATAMDTTLFFVTRYGDREAGTVALASGLLLTVAASLILPLVLALPL